jgi:hypothetical protein
MDRTAAITQIRDACKNIVREQMRIPPAIAGLGDQAAQDELFKTLFELTKQVETIKKRLAKLESKDDTTVL